MALESRSFLIIGPSIAPSLLGFVISQATRNLISLPLSPPAVKPCRTSEGQVRRTSATPTLFSSSTSPSVRLQMIFILYSRSTGRSSMSSSPEIEGLVIRVVLHLFDISIKMKLTKLWKGLMDERLMAEKSLFSLLNTALMQRRFQKEELWNHLQGHEGQEAVVLEGAVALIDAVVLGEAAVPAGGPEMITGKETTGRGAEVEAMKGRDRHHDKDRDYRRRSRSRSASPDDKRRVRGRYDDERRSRSRSLSASPARRSRSPISASPLKASPERRSKERSLTPASRSRSPRSPSLEKASPERKSNDRSPSPRDTARSQSPNAEVG
ncbi:BnaA06g23350D [Brassica napus]|uniref:BnaA06g23350D protein n=1 Tax=Brassica napus TaxID=3708 RepID=A0A078I2H1_BRANA|nr:BnaA06g23350D [Brassica napus]